MATTRRPLRLCVFCGSSPGNHPIYVSLARRVGRLLARRGIGVVYGGASLGLMGALADGALSAGGSVIGVIPRALQDRELAHTGPIDLRVVNSMHERKRVMASLADGFIAMPGGLGTLEELFEVWTWAQLGFHAKPLGLLDVRGYYAPLAAFLDSATSEGFVRENYRRMLIVGTRPARLIDRLTAEITLEAPVRSEQLIRRGVR